MLRDTLIAAAAFATGASAHADAQLADLVPRQSNGSVTTPDFFSPSAPTVPVNLTGDPDFDFQLYVAMDLAQGGGAGTADLLNAASYIPPLNMEAFANTFWALGNQTLAIAEQLSNDSPSSKITTRESYFAASTYYRFADFYLHGDPTDPRLKILWAQQLSAFNQGLSRMTNAKVTPFNLTTKYNFTIPGYYYSIDGRRRPTIIITTGYDAPQQHWLHWLGPQILEHGWNFATYEGPGQPTVVHEQGIGFRPDWEVVLSPVIDWLERQPTADLSKLTSIGMSMGGYLAARAAAFDRRVKAQVLNGGITSLYTAFSLHFGPLLALLGHNNTEFDAIVYKNVIDNPNATTYSRWGVENGLYTFDTRSPADWLIQSKSYNASTFLNRTNIPTWVVNGTADAFFPNMSAEFAAALQARHVPVTLAPMGGVAGLHDQPAASLELNRQMWTWINKIWPNTPAF